MLLRGDNEAAVNWVRRCRGVRSLDWGAHAPNGSDRACEGLSF